MSRANAFALKIDPLRVEGLADKLDGFDAARIGAVLVQVVNEVTSKFDTSARRGMNAGINLSDEYISSRMTFVAANDAENPSASITAQGPRAGLTTLGHYSPVVTYVPARTGRRAKGDPKRGVPAGFKASGVKVQVSKSRRVEIPGAFTMTLRRGTVAGDQVGVFVRPTPGGKARHLYAVAPYSLFRHQVEIGIEGVADDLATQTAIRITDEAGRLFA